jgi:hypothetical protein
MTILISHLFQLKMYTTSGVFVTSGKIYGAQPTLLIASLLYEYSTQTYPVTFPRRSGASNHYSSIGTQDEQ